MAITQNKITEGSGNILPAYEPGSRTLSNNGMMAPGEPGHFLGSEVWSANTLSAVRHVPSEDMMLTFLWFYVITAATANDPCHVGIMDVYGDVLWDSGALLGELNSVGDKYITVPSPQAISNGSYQQGGKPFYLVFSYGSVGGTAAEILTVNYHGTAPLPHGYSSPNNFGYMSTAMWLTVNGAITTPTGGPGAGYFNYGQAAAMAARHW